MTTDNNILTDLKALAAKSVTKEELNAVIAKYEPKRKVRDGYREPKLGGRFFLVAGTNGVDERGWDEDNRDKQYLASGNCYEHRRNAELVAENRLLLSKFTRWIDEHGAENSEHYNLVSKNQGEVSSICVGRTKYVGALLVPTPICYQFIRENETDLRKYFANEETLRRTLYE